MANRDIVYGIRITGDATSAVVEAKKVDKAFDEVAATLDRAESTAGTAQAAMAGVVSPAAVAGIKAGGGAANEAAGHVARLGVSAGQTAQAMRQLPMQFSDIVVSLQAGQSPMQVLLQQGSQIKDSFGGAGAAAKAMGGYVAGLVGPFTLAAAGVGVLTAAWVQGSSEAEAYEKTLASTGNRAGVTAGELSAMAESIDQVAGTQGSAAEILNQLAAGGKVASGQMEEVGAAISAMAETGMRDVESLVKEFEAIGEEPVKGILKINDAYNFLTPTIYGQIKALQEQGKMEEAIALAQSEAAKGVKQRAAEVEAATGAMEKGWRSLVNVVREAWDAMKNVGRESLQQQVAAQKKLIADINAGDQVGNVEVAQRYLKTLEDQVAAEKKAAEGGAARAASMKGFLATEKEVAAAQERGAKQTRTLTQALGEYRENLDKIRAADPKSVMLDPAKVAAGEAAIRKEFETTAKVRRAAAATPGERLDSTWVQRIQVLKAQASATESLTETERAAIRVMTDFANGKLKLTAAEKARLPGLVQEALLLDDAAEAAKKAAVEQAALAKAQEAAIDAVRADTQALLAKLDAAQFEAETYGMTEEAVYRLLAARAADRAEMNAFGDANDAVIAELKAQEKAYLDLADAAGAKASRDAVRKAGEDARASAQRFSDDLERALTDSLMRSFEAGKGFGEAFLDSIKNMLKTAALKAVVQVVAQPVTSSFAGGSTGVAGMSGGGSGGIGNLLSMGNSAAGMSSLSAYTGAAGYMQFGSMASSFGTALTAASTGADLGAAIAAYEAAGMGATASSLSAGASVAGSVGSGAASALGSVMSGLATAAPYLAVALLVAQQLGAFKGPTYHHGGAYMADTEGTLTKANSSNFTDFNLGWGAYTVDRSSGFDDAMLAMSQGVAKQIEASIKAYGGQTGNLTVGTRFASDNDDWSEGAIRIVNEAGERVYDFTKRYTSDSGKALQQFGEDATRALVATLKATDLNDEFDALFAGVDPLKASVAELNAVLERATAIQQQTASVRAAIDSNFLEPAEQLQKAFQVLGQSVPDSAAAYEALVRAQDLNSTAGRQLAASLLDVYGQWKQVEDAAQATVQAAADAVAGERLQLEQQLLQAQGNTAELRARELAQLDPSNRAMQERIWALEEESRIIAEREGLDLRLLQAQGDTAELRARELAQLDPSNRAIQERIWALEDEASAASTAADAARTMADMWSGIYSDAADGIAESASAMLATLDKAAQRERTRLTAARDVASEAVTSVRSVLDLLSGSMASLYGSVDATAVMQAADAMSLISGAAAGGYMPSKDELSAAISAAQAGMSGKVYASQVDADRDRLVLAGQLSKIQAAGAAQLPVAERALKTATDQLSALDKSVELYRDQLNELRGIRDVSVDIGGTIEEVGARLVEELRAQTASFAQSVIGAVQAGRLGTGVAATQLAKAGVETDQFSQVGGQSVYLSSRGALYTSSDNTIRTNNGWAGSVEDARTIVAQTFASSSPADFYAAAVKVGLSGAMIEEMYQMPKGTAADWAKANNLPAFAVGTDYVPNDMLALVHQGERITPAPYSGQQERLLEALITEVKSLRATLAAVAAETRRTANAVNGNPDAPMLVETV